MADALIKVRRSCPPDAFEKLEGVVADHVGHAVYGHRYPKRNEVDAAAMYGTLGTYMALKVEIDTEDLPGDGWYITPSGLCVRSDPRLVLPEYKPVPLVGLTNHQRNAHFAVLGREITETLAADPIWEEGNIGWEPGMDPLHKLGVLVARAEGAWHATYSDPQ